MKPEIEKALGTIDKLIYEAEFANCPHDYGTERTAIALLREELERLEKEKHDYMTWTEAKTKDRLREAEAERDAEMRRGNEWHDHADAAEADLARWKPLIEAAGNDGGEWRKIMIYALGLAIEEWGRGGLFLPVGDTLEDWRKLRALLAAIPEAEKQAKEKT